MANFGEYRRIQPRLRVVRGYPGNEPSHLTLSAPVQAGLAPGTIKSGMVISLADGAGIQVGQKVWVLSTGAAGAAASGRTPYFAIADDTDTDVQASGKLLGLSCAGDFELQTGYVVELVPGATYPVIADGVYGDGKPIIANVAGAGKVTVAAAVATSTIVGYTKIPFKGGYSGQDAAGVHTAAAGALLDLTSVDNVKQVFQSYNSESANNNGGRVTVLNLITRWNNI